MNRFQHHPDGLVIVELDGLIYVDTPENFALDSGVPYAGLPAGMVSLLYQPGRLCAYFTADGAQVAGPEDVAPCDAALANVAALVAAKQAREDAAAAALAAPAPA